MPSGVGSDCAASLYQDLCRDPDRLYKAELACNLMVLRRRCTTARASIPRSTGFAAPPPPPPPEDVVLPLPEDDDEFPPPPDEDDELPLELPLDDDDDELELTAVGVALASLDAPLAPATLTALTVK